MPLLLLLLALVQAPAITATKVGMCCEGCNATTHAPFSNVSSWACRCSLFVDDPGAASWLAANGVEFVAHLAHHHVPLPNNAACNFDHAHAGGEAF